MSRILLLGAGPVPEATSTLTCSYNLRTEKLAHWLAREGFDFQLAAVDIFNTFKGQSENIAGRSCREQNPRDGGVTACECPARQAGPTASHHAALGKDGLPFRAGDREAGGVETRASLVGEYSLFSKNERGREALAGLIREMQPAAILATSYEAAAMVCEIGHDRPVWADMPGWIMAEAQLKAASAGDDVYVEHFLERERAVLRRADVISVVSRNQRHATLGELAMLGRLTRRNAGYNLVRVLPSLAMNWTALLEGCEPQANVAERLNIPHEAPVLLWSGGYNLWTDLERIFGVLTPLMQAIPRLHFVSTGGAIPTHNDQLYGEFLTRIEACEFRNRLHILPWLPFQEALGWLGRAAIGVCVDGVNIEIDYGSRTRVADMLSHGLAVAATTGTELLNDLAQAGAVIALDPAAPEGWAKAIEPYLLDPARLADLASRGKATIYEHYALDTVGRELREWLKAPRRAPDLLWHERLIEFHAACGMRNKSNAKLRKEAAKDRKEENPSDMGSVIVNKRCGADRESWMEREPGPPPVDYPLVTWEPQRKVEAVARRVLDPYAPGRASQRLQKCWRALLANRVSWWPAMAAWWIGARVLTPLAAARWQSRVDSWNEAVRQSVKERQLPTIEDHAINVGRQRPVTQRTPKKAQRATKRNPPGDILYVKTNHVQTSNARCGAQEELRKGPQRRRKGPQRIPSENAINRVGRSVYARALRGAEPGPAKAINILLARHEYDRTGALACFPQRIEIEPTSVCNIRCRMCKIPYLDKPAVNMSPEVFGRIEPYLKYVATLEIIGEGEPTLNPNLANFLEAAHGAGCQTRMFSNGTRLTPELSAAMVRTRLDTLIFSVCAGEREAYRRVTGADLLEQVIENVRDLREIKRLAGSVWPRLKMNCPLIRETLAGAPALVRLAGELGIESMNLGIAMIFREAMAGESLMNVEREEVQKVFEQCEALGRRVGVQVFHPDLNDAPGASPQDDDGRNRFGCLYPWQSLRIRADGLVEACTYNRKILGDLNKATLGEIWNGGEARRFRANQARDNGVNHCEICYHRGYRAGHFSRENMFVYDQCWYGYE